MEREKEEEEDEEVVGGMEKEVEAAVSSVIALLDSMCIGAADEDVEEEDAT